MYDMPVTDQIQQLEELLEAGSLMSLLSAIPSSILSLAVYAITAYALYTLAKRRGIANPWLAWIPVISTWTLGAIADDYRLKAMGEKKSRRKVLLGTQIAFVALLLTMFVIVIAVIVGFFRNMNFDTGDISEDFSMTVGLAAIGMLVIWLPLMVLTVVHTVFQYIALYDLYRSCEPGNAVLYLVLSILISITQPVFLLLCRNKDDGMPKPQPQIPPVMCCTAVPEQENAPTQL